MPLLQVRDCPDDLYSSLSVRAKEQNRSIAQQTVFILKETFALQEDAKRINRSKALNALDALNLEMPLSAPSAVSLIRSERDSSPAFIPEPLK